MQRLVIIFTGLFASLFASSTPAAENWNLCRIPAYVFSGNDDIQAAATEVEAQTIVSEDSDSLRLSGDVRLSRAAQNISADQMLIYKADEILEASGNVEFENANYRLRSPAIRVDHLSDRANFETPEFELRGRHARGRADRIEQLDRFRSRFSDLHYSTCDPGDRDWHLRAKKLQIDDESGRGTATHTTLFFQDIPFLYLPYFQFPIDDRRLSGILAPRISYTEDRGTDLLLPIYWNMAPNYDMTVTPAWYAERGLQWNSENRYLFSRHRGQLDLSYVDDDDFNDTRWFQRWRHRASLDYAIHADLLLAKVSDDEFFDDFDQVAPEYNNIRHLERHVRFSGRFANWDTGLLYQRYQTLDRSTSIASRPYNRLPRLSLAGDMPPLLDATASRLNLEWAEFDRDNSVTGRRTHLVAAIDWEASDSWYFVKPELQLAFTDYRLDNNPTDNEIQRGLPTLGFDTGLIFERQAGSQNQWLQTLEPRMYFLHTPFDDQDDIPDFDTSNSSRTYINLFKNNRFSGADRIGDASQVTFGLTSRIYDNNSGDELLNARIGQIFYFEDRRVSLSGERDDAPKSDAIAEIDVWPSPGTRITSRLVYDQAQSDLTERDLSITYSDAGYVANLGYYFDEDELEQTLLSMVYPLNESWTLIAKYHSSIRFDKPVEHLLGVSYESCCWGLKILASQTGDDDEDFAETENSIFLELTLKGLSAAGQEIDSRLQRTIPGYAPRF